MNFLVSDNFATIDQFQPVLKERGEVELLASFAELLGRAEVTGSGLAILDTGLPGYTGDADLKRLKRANASLKILLVGLPRTPREELAALAAGAMGCCGPALSAEQIRRILAIVDDGGVWISNAALPLLLEQLRKRASQSAAKEIDAVQAQAAMEGLTQREREISQMVAAGLSNKIIARKLDITDRTVKAHLTAVFQKLNVRDRLQLALYVTKGAQN